MFHLKQKSAFEIRTWQSVFFNSSNVAVITNATHSMQGRYEALFCN